MTHNVIKYNITMNYMLKNSRKCKQNTKKNEKQKWR